MKVLIVSDNHGNTAVLKKIKQTHQDIQYFIHCGDYCSDEKNDFFIRVKGNCDYENIPEMQIVEIDCLRFLIIHGHLYPRNQLINRLFFEAKKLKCDVVCFGHIHQRVFEKREEIIVINPGSVSYNYDFTIPGYAIFDTISKTIEFIKLGEET